MDAHRIAASPTHPSESCIPATSHSPERLPELIGLELEAA